jgi:hypothetical protein
MDDVMSRNFQECTYSMICKVIGAARLFLTVGNFPGVCRKCWQGTESVAICKSHMFICFLHIMCNDMFY